MLNRDYVLIAIYSRECRTMQENSQFLFKLRPAIDIILVVAEFEKFLA